VNSARETVRSGEFETKEAMQNLRSDLLATLSGAMSVGPGTNPRSTHVGERYEGMAGISSLCPMTR
jgi:hypothetical protein